MKKLFFIIFLFLFSQSAFAVGGINISFGEQGTKPGDVADTLEIMFILTIIVLSPSILILMTSFTRIIIVLGFLRRALGLQTMPPDQVLVGITLFISFFIMWPTGERIYEEAWVPYKQNKGTTEDFRRNALKPIREFMIEQTRDEHLNTMLDLADIENVQFKEDVPIHVIIPAFVMSELTRAFKIGFLIYLPFFLVDMVVAAILMSMGMMMLPPVMISLPFKILLFILVDGWNLLIINLIKGFIPL